MESPPPPPGVLELLADDPNRYEKSAGHGAHALAAWIDDLDPHIAERIARILTDRAAHSLFGQARARAVARLVDANPDIRIAALAREQHLSVATFRKLLSLGRTDLNDSTRKDPA